MQMLNTALISACVITNSAKIQYENNFEHVTFQLHPKYHSSIESTLVSSN